jgi:hypothetical protein
MGGNPTACPDSEVYDRLGRLEQRASADRVRWEGVERRDADRAEADEKRDEKLDRLAHGMTRLNTTIWVATGIVGTLIALAGIIVPLLKG